MRYVISEWFTNIMVVALAIAFLYTTLDMARALQDVKSNVYRIVIETNGLYIAGE